MVPITILILISLLSFSQESTTANNGFNSSIEVVGEVQELFNKTICSGYVRKIRSGFSKFKLLNRSLLKVNDLNLFRICL